MNDSIEALIAAHVEYELSQLRGEALARTLKEQLAAVFEWLADVRLNDVASPERVMGVIDRDVIQFRVSGGITELAGEMARLVIASQSGQVARLDQILTDESYSEFAEQILSLDRVRRELITTVAHSDSFGTVASRLLSQVLTDLLFRRHESAHAERPLGLAEIKSMVEARVLPALEQRFEVIIARFIEQHRERIARDSERHLLDVLDADCLRGIVDEFWNATGRQKLSDVFALLGEENLEDFVVLCFEFWLRFRKTAYFRTIMLELVAYFFNKYGEQSLASLIDDMGVTEAMVHEELVTQIGPLLHHAEVSGFLQERLRAHLEPFYRSPGVAAILAQRG